MPRTYYAGYKNGSRCCGRVHKTIAAAIRCRERAYQTMARRGQAHYAMRIHAQDSAGGDDLPLNDAELEEYASFDV